MTPTINEPTLYASNPWKNAVAMLMGEPFDLPPARSVRPVKGRNDPRGKDTGFDMDEALERAGFNVDTDPQDCQEFDA